jgi:hypothetical protein
LPAIDVALSLPRAGEAQKYMPIAMLFAMEQGK